MAHFRTKTTVTMATTIREQLPCWLGALLAWALCVSAAPAWAGPAPIPHKHIPSSVLLEIHSLEQHFKSNLLRDCPSEHCMAKGCNYSEHMMVDAGPSSALPGIGSDKGPGSAAGQAYLTAAQCEFAYERTLLTAKEAQALARRLGQGLSKGWLHVSVLAQPLLPAPAALQTEPEPTPVAVSVDTDNPVEQPTIGWQLWSLLSPHTPWLVAWLLALVSCLLLIWALRRLGKPSVAEQMMLAEAAQGTLAGQDTAESKSATVPAGQGESVTNDEQSASPMGQASSAQMAPWRLLMTATALAEPGNLGAKMLQHWLSQGQYALIQQASTSFGVHIVSALGGAQGAKALLQQAELMHYLAQPQGNQPLSEQAWLAQLQACASTVTLLGQEDMACWAALRAELGTQGGQALLTALPERLAACALCMLSPEQQHGVVPLLPSTLRAQLAACLLRSNRMTAREQQQLLHILRALQAGQPWPAMPAEPVSDWPDMGSAVPCAEPLALLLGSLEEPARAALLQEMYQVHGERWPQWYQELLYPQMLLQLSASQCADVLLQAEPSSLWAWLSQQLPSYQQALLDRLEPAVQQSLQASGAKRNNGANPWQLAAQARVEMVAAVQQLLARRELTLTMLLQ